MGVGVPQMVIELHRSSKRYSAWPIVVASIDENDPGTALVRSLGVANAAQTEIDLEVAVKVDTFLLFRRRLVVLLNWPKSV